ncbi:MAG: isoleucine--tRNA ligase [Deltaproteobacteria bacterium]|nr:isoleucine--tRNA ligase [Deltaproteobacteria bacterium]
MKSRSALRAGYGHTKSSRSIGRDRGYEVTQELDYKNTILLPKTAFPMRANLAQREPQVLKRWQEQKIYERVLESRAGAESYVFHDGPPYANGNIHYGHVLNKLLKDVVVKYQCLSGKLAKFVPGWDCHGLPIELGVERKLKREKSDLSKQRIREACRNEAEKWVEIQREEFKRLGVFGTWDSPYLTMQPEYERGIIEALSAFIEHDLLYRGKKPVYWCGHCRTALAEAEVEYRPHESPSIYVKFPLSIENTKEIARRFALSDSAARLPAYVLIWTTTPWTLTANLAVAFHPDFDYQAVDAEGELWIIAKGLVPAVLDAAGKPAGRPQASIKGKDLAGIIAKHPFVDRDSPLLPADFVTLETGTGLVHIAPGHGADDYRLGQQYGLETFAPVDEDARFTDDVPEAWRGMHVFEANPLIVRFLAEQKLLANRDGEVLTHSYPNCWRCKNPIVFRATTQWFIAIDRPLKGRDDGKTLRDIALSEIDAIARGRDLPLEATGLAPSGWIPSWGRDRIYGMLKERPDWCISRQRAWGVPIPALHCRQCGQVHLTEAIARHVAELFGREGADSWYREDESELIPPGFRCNRCGGDSFEKDGNILDVWFESGASFWATMRDREAGFGLPVDLYLEGSDQHRGWFHSSLLVGAALLGRAPYKRVLTHGFVCDDKGRPYSKSEILQRMEAGEKVEYIEPATVVKQQGAELLRLWVAYEDFRSDVGFSKDHLIQVSEAYFKIRNTIRFLLGNLSDYQPDALASEIDPLDAWANARLRKYLNEVVQAYERFDFRTVFHRTVEICIGDWSAFYLDVVKDRLYCDQADSPRRRSVQLTLNRIARGTISCLAPILVFTADEAWRHLPGEQDGSVFLNGSVVAPPIEPDDDALLAAGSLLLETRDALNLALEAKVKAKEIGHRREVAALLTLPRERIDSLTKVSSDLAEAFAVSSVEVREGKTVSVQIERNASPRCPRCWRHRSDIGDDRSHADLCERCARVITQREAVS